MNNDPVDKAIANATASVEMEGYHIDNRVKVWCKQLLENEITKEDYLKLIMKKAGVIS